MRVSRRFFLRKMLGYMSTRAVTRLSTQTNCKEQRSHLHQPILTGSPAPLPFLGQIQACLEETVASVWQKIALHLRLYLAVESKQNNHQEEEARPEWREGQHDHSPRVGDECQARPCSEKGFRVGNGSGMAWLAQASLRPLSSQGTACHHAAFCSSYTSTVSEAQAPQGMEEPSGKGGTGDTASSG